MYEQPRNVSVGDCDFYHVMDLPGVGHVGGQWDLRGHVDEYLGNVDLGGKRVLEIGPASGFLTVEMERRGAEVVAVDVADDPGWDFVPYPAAVLGGIMPGRREHMRRVKNSFWLTHQANAAKSKIYYGDACNLPDLGRFDVAVMAAVLLHTRSPVAIMEECAKRADTLVITDCLNQDIEGSPICRLIPTRSNNVYDAWWHFSSEFFTQFLQVMGFNCVVTRHAQLYAGNPVDLFTIVATR